MSDGQLAIVGVGSVALWHASRLSTSVVGFEASSPAHPRSAVGGDTRLRVIVSTDSGSWVFDRVIVASGSWSRGMRRQAVRTARKQRWERSAGHLNAWAAAARRTELADGRLDERAS